MRPRATTVSGPVTDSGRRFVKHISRIESVRDPSPDRKKVPLFRINSIISDEGIQEHGEDPQRQQWDSPLEFLLTCISMSVGLGNVWRFPFTAYENGGGAFLIPYLLVLLLIGRPMYFLELALGQFSSSGSVKFWDMVPAFKGVGYGQLVANACVVSYYCSLIALSIFYLAVSFRTTLPWTVCDPVLEAQRPGVTCIPSISSSNTSGIDSNETLGLGNKAISSEELYFTVGVLKENPDISSGLGLPDTNLSCCLAICWFLLYFTLKNGVSGSGKVAYFTAIFPYLVLFTFLIKGLTLEGATDGLLFFFMGIGFGTLITFSSYNKFSQNINKDALIISF